MNPLAEIEGLLFISGDEGISLGDLAKVTGYLKPAILEMIAQLKEKYQQDENCALTLLDSDSVYRLATKAQLADVMQHYFEEPLTTPLTQTLLEVLAIVAYKQPVTKQEIEAIRGVKSDFAVNKLLEYQLIKELGRLETHGRLAVPGRPFLYVTTPAFLDYFGLTTLDELPELDKNLQPEDLDGDIFLRALQSRQMRKESLENEDGKTPKSNG